MAPVGAALRKNSEFEVRVCVAAPHWQMLDQVLELFNVNPKLDLDLMKPGQDLTDITCKVLVEMRQELRQW